MSRGPVHERLATISNRIRHVLGEDAHFEQIFGKRLPRSQFEIKIGRNAIVGPATVEELSFFLDGVAYQKGDTAEMVHTAETTATDETETATATDETTTEPATETVAEPVHDKKHGRRKEVHATA